MNQVISWLQGKKTYIVAGLSLITGLLAYLNGKESLTTALTNVPGLLVFLGAGLASARAAVAKVSADVKSLIK